MTLASPKSLPDFTRLFPDEAAVVGYLYALRWPDGRPCGLDCEGGEDVSFYEGGRVIYCPACKRKVSLTAGTIMHRSQHPLLVWFYAIFLVTTLTPGISAVQLSKQLGISLRAAFQMLHKIRAAMVNPDRDPLAGVVEADETYVGGVQHGGKGGRSTEGRTVVLGAVEVRKRREGGGRYAGRLRLRAAPGARKVDIDSFFRDHVARGTVVLTDGWEGYRNLRSLGYDHRPVVEGDPENAARILPIIHREFSNLKTWLQGTHHGRVERQHLQAYLNEFAFRHNRRFWTFSAFRRLLQIGVETEALQWNEVYGADEYGRNIHVAGFAGERAKR